MTAEPLELDDYLDAVTEPDDVRSGTFQIDTVDQADWAVRKLRRLRAERDRKTVQAAEQIERIQAWRNREHGRLDGDIRFFEGLLEGWHRRRIEQDGKAAYTIDLPSGELRSRFVRGRWSVVDEDAALEWAKTHLPEALEVRLSKKTVNGYVKETGEKVPGVERGNDYRSFSVEVRE